MIDYGTEEREFIVARNSIGAVLMHWRADARPTKAKIERELRAHGVRGRIRIERETYTVERATGAIIG